MSVILGIDPGLATVGFGVIQKTGHSLKWIDHGVIKTKPGLELAERLCIIKKDFDSLLAQYKPDAIGVEQLFFAKNVTNGILVAHARGVILAQAHENKIPLFEFTPLQVKNNIAGDGVAQKWQVQEMVKRILSLNSIPKPDDAADGLAIAICAERLFSDPSRIQAI